MVHHAQYVAESPSHSGWPPTPAESGERFMNQPVCFWQASIDAFSTRLRSMSKLDEWDHVQRSGKKITRRI